MYHYTCALLALGLSLHVRAAPTASRLLSRQDQGSQGGGGSIGPTIWVPLVVIGVLFAVGLVVACCNRRFRAYTYGRGFAASQAAGATAGTTTGGGAREVTADQLAGTNGAAAGANATNAAGGANRSRRPRRTRRTPSQISTHSLPAYMKEPGEQEIVIVSPDIRGVAEVWNGLSRYSGHNIYSAGRGAEDMEDMPVPITVTMPAVDEQGVESPEGSIDLARPTSEYVPMPNTSNDVPLLQNNEHDPHHLGVEAHDLGSRRSFDSIMSSEENSQVHYLDDAPPYEVVTLDSTPNLTTSASTPPTAPPAAQVQERSSMDQSGTGSTRRRSMFMSIFNPRSSRIAPPPVPTNANSPEPRASGHTRDNSSLSVLSVAPSERDPRPRSRVRHRPSQSGSGSMFSLLSRTRSNGNLDGAGNPLTSPSMISLNSISAPLSHTLVRTEFTYPKSGPTPEQLKLISSRETFARFGVPYGADAIAYASASRVELEPPPGFEEVAGPSGAADASSSEGRNESPAPDTAARLESPAPAEANANMSSVSEGSPVPALASNAQAPSEAAEAGESSPGREDNAAETLTSPPPSAFPAPASTSDSSHSEASSSSDSERPSSPPGLQPPPVSAPALSPTSPTMASAGTISPASPNANAPPSAFKGAFPTGSLPTRAASRASSYMSFATAEESIAPSEPPTPGASRLDLQHGDDAYESAAETPANGSAPTTPRLETRHPHESTDTTITPGR
ncbi:hypothetical protein C8Q78DRAFT_990792 [Trametes maxima]|nr:hypothetical protein C8Q78DRAFT_990792 [Trametes maxima]